MLVRLNLFSAMRFTLSEQAIYVFYVEAFLFIHFQEKGLRICDYFLSLFFFFRACSSVFDALKIIF